METKALKKQLGAAIAMVVVAAIALGSATYAWFVSNNSVTATTVGVSAQSNSAFLLIDTAATSTSSGTEASATYSNVSLYPAIWDNTFDAAGTVASDSSGKYQFESAYASSKDSAKEKDNKSSRFLIGDGDTAKEKSYATLNTFYVGTGGYDGSFTDLKVKDFTVTDSNNLATAVRVLVTDGNNWVVVRKSLAASGSDAGRAMVESQSLPTTGDGAVESGVFHTSEFGKTGGDVTVKCYVYYDGSDDSVYTTYLDQIKEAGCKVTLTFEATPKEYK